MLRVRPIELADANAYVGRLHRHHDPVVGHRFSLSAWNDETLHGVAIVGRPVAKSYDKLRVLEVLRLCTDGTPNACSILYAAAARAGLAIGYETIQTYILDSEPGTSLKAAGWSLAGTSPGGEWNHTDETHGLFGSNRKNTHPTGAKQRWEKTLALSDPKKRSRR